jgi:1,4-alpha-glucan branching enzyme
MTSSSPATLDSYFFREGTHTHLYDWLGAHSLPTGKGMRFSVWAPNATAVSVIGDWNGWRDGIDVMQASPTGDGTWSCDAVAAHIGNAYKFKIDGPNGYSAEKADPMARQSEHPPKTASCVAADAHHEWQDSAWMTQRASRAHQRQPMTVYELHPGSWRRQDGEFLGYRELARQLAEYVIEMGFTHVELMPITEHPFYGSWGYQTTGYFAPTARYGAPEDLMFLVDHLHANGIGVILDWVPSHFPTDAHGLQFFDGTHLYEHADPRQGFHPEWNSSIFNLGRNEVRSFLLSSAMYWLEHFHFDGLRVDAVASMLYLDYARKPGEWIPNIHGGRENLAAIDFLRTLNDSVRREHPGTLTIAEESTAWPKVSGSTSSGGLGFDMKWNMGWMHDTLDYMERDPIYRQHAQGQLTFSLVYAFSERFLLPLSHDEVVHGKGSLLGKMPGDAWQKFANLRALYGYMWGHPGKKLLFMGCEFGQGPEWAHDGELRWDQLGLESHRGVQKLVAALNRLHREIPALHQLDDDPTGFEWIASDDSNASVIAFLRKSYDGSAPVLVVCNFTPVPRGDYRLGVPQAGAWRTLLNTDEIEFGGSGFEVAASITADNAWAHGRANSLRLSLPPLGVLFMTPSTVVSAS